MSVLSVDLPITRVGVLRTEACKFGVSYEGVVAQEFRIPLAHPHYVTVDLAGDPERMIRVALRSGGKPVHNEAEVPHFEQVRVYGDRREGRG